MLGEEDQLAFARALRDALRSGLPAVTTLRDLAPRYGAALATASESAGRGETLHASLAAAGLFPPLFIALVRAGEESGKTDAFLDRYCAWLETRVDFRRRLTRAFFYPAAAALLAAALFALFTLKAAPLLLQPLVDAGVPLPDSVSRSQELAARLAARRPLLLGAAAVLVLALRALARSRAGRRFWALLGHWAPGFRYALSEARHHQVASALGLLLGAGLRPRQTMDLLLLYFADDPVLSRRFARAAASFAEGGGFADALGPALPAEDRDRLRVAERGGRLDETLGKLADAHHARHSHRLKLLATGFQLAAVAALAPVCFALVMGIVAPTLALLRQGAGPLAGAYRAAPGERGSPSPLPAPAPVPRSEAARFNETRAREVTDFMRASAPGGAPAAKPVPRPKLKPRDSFKKIESTPIKSSLDR